MHFAGGILSCHSRQIPSMSSRLLNGFAVLVIEYFSSLQTLSLHGVYIGTACRRWPPIDFYLPYWKPWQLDLYALCHCLAWSDTLCHRKFLQWNVKNLSRLCVNKLMCGLQMGPNLFRITVLFKVILLCLLIVDELISREGFLAISVCSSTDATSLSSSSFFFQIHCYFHSNLGLCSTAMFSCSVISILVLLHAMLFYLHSPLPTQSWKHSFPLLRMNDSLLVP